LLALLGGATIVVVSRLRVKRRLKRTYSLAVQLVKLSIKLAARIARAERDDTRAETTFRLSLKRTSPFKSMGGVSSVDCYQPRCAHQLE